MKAVIGKDERKKKLNEIFAKWKQARNHKETDVQSVVDTVKKGLRCLTRGYNRKDYKLVLEGLQRRGQKEGAEKGEVKIEKSLLSKACVLVKGEKNFKEVMFRGNAFYLGGKRRGNVIADLFGFDESGSPVAGEVKDTANDAWHAVVQCIQQVVLMRGDQKELERCLRNARCGGRLKGAWGIVIAPPKFWRRNTELVEKKVKPLLQELRKRTDIRVCCVSIKDDKAVDSKDRIQLEIKCGMPPVKKTPL